MSESGDPFDVGPFARVPRALPLAPDCERPRWNRVLTAIAIGWLPLVVLAAFGGVPALGAGPRARVLLDATAYARYLVAAPLLVLAASIVLPQLARVVRQFEAGDLVTDRDRPAFDGLVASTRRVLASPWDDVAIVALAYALAYATSPLARAGDAAAWTMSHGMPGRLSLAGWWRTLVSQPLFNALLLVWLWRLLLWIRFLWRATRMDLRLVAAHPDRLGGLRFVLSPLRGFALLAFAIGSVFAGDVADSIFVEGRSLSSFQHLVGAQVALVLVLFAGPMLLLTPPLVRLQAWGTFHYGRLATVIGHAFEQRWLAGQRTDVDPLVVNDFSALGDLFSVVANVREVNTLVLDVWWLAGLALATLLPYVPVVLAVFPIDDVLRFALKAIT